MLPMHSDKLRFEAIENQALLSDDAELSIALDVDTDGRTLTIHDNGIGMSREELIENIGTIAKSGTKEFINKIKAQKEATGLSADLIGQFGVGFYSAFMVADKCRASSPVVPVKSKPIVGALPVAKVIQLKSVSVHLKEPPLP